MQSQARKESIARHVAKLDQIKIQPYREEGAAIRDSAAEAGQSVQAYVLQAVRERIKRDKHRSPVDTGDAAMRGALPSVGLPFPTGMPGQSVKLVLQALREDSFRAALEVCGKTGENVSDFIDRAIWKALEQAME